MPDYKQCTATMMGVLMDEREAPETGYVQAPNGLYYGITDPTIPYLCRLDQLRYWIQQDVDMDTLFGSGAVINQTTISTWFGGNMTTTYKFMASLQFIVTHIFATITPNKEFDLATNAGQWEITFVNSGSNPVGGVPEPSIC